MAFDPSQPFETVVTEPPRFDPDQPFEAVTGFDPTQPFETVEAPPGAIAGTVNEFKRGVVTATQAAVAAERERAPKRLSMGSLRRAYVNAMSDPRYVDALNRTGSDTNKLDAVENLYGPTAHVQRMDDLLAKNRQFLDVDIAQLEAEAQAIPQSDAMQEWGKADNSNWFVALAKNPVEITAGIMAQSLPAMAPTLAATAITPGGPAARAATVGAGSYSTETAHAYLDAARQAGFDLTDEAQVQAFYNDAGAQAKAKRFAAQRGVPIAVLDALTAGVAGKFLGPALKVGGKSAVLKATVKEIALQAAGGAGGEAVAQVASGQPLSVKDMVAEAIGEIGGGPVEVVSNLREAKRGNPPLSGTLPQGGEGTIQRPPDDELPPGPGPDAPDDSLARRVEDEFNKSSATAELPKMDVAVEPPAATSNGGSDNEVLRAGVPRSVPVPEAPGTIAAQMDLLRSGKRDVVLITPGETLPPVPEGFQVYQKEGREDVGTFIYNPRKVREGHIGFAISHDTLGNILGYGISTKPKPGTEVGVVTVRTPAGTEKQAVVTDEANLPRVVAAARQVAAPNDTVRLEKAEDVLEARRAESKSTPHPQSLSPVEAEREEREEGIDTSPPAPLPGRGGEGGPSRSAVTERHRAQAREVLQQQADAERPPDIIDELEGSVTSGVIKLPGADFRDAIDNARERVAQARFKRGFTQLRKAQRDAIDRQLRVSSTTGEAADLALNGLARQNRKYADWSVDRFAQALLDAGEGRLTGGKAPSAAAVEALAEEMARAGASRTGNENAQSDEQAVPENAQDAIDSWLTEAIEATDINRTRTLEGVLGAPVWLTKAALNGVLRVVRATYRGTKNLAQAIQAGLDWLRAQNLPNYSETEARRWLETQISTTPNDDDINIREFTDQLDADQPLPPDPARMVGNLLYQRRTNESDAAFAVRIIEAVGGPQAAIEVFRDATNGLPGSVRMMLGQLIIKQLGVAGQHEAAVSFYDDMFAGHVTDTAQALQSLGAFLALTPEGKLIWARRKIERAANDVAAVFKPNSDEAAQAVAAINRDGVEATTASTDVQLAARDAVDAALDQQAGTPGTELQLAIRNAVLDALVQSGLLTAREAEIARLHFEGTADNSTLAEKLQRANIPLHDERAKAITELYRAKTKAEREKIKSRARRAREKQTAKEAVKGDVDAIDLAIKRAMKDLRVTLGRVIREHHTQVDALGKTLAEKIAAASGLPEADAKKLADAVQKRFEQLVTKRKRAELEKLLKPVKRMAKPELIERLLAASNLGALSQEQFWKILRPRLNLPGWSPELAERIRKQVDVIERTPADQVERKQKAQIDLLNTIERAKGLDGFDLGLAFYITNILTGLTTHVKNVGSTFLNVSMSLGTELARSVATGQLGDIPLVLEALGQGMKQGGRAAADVLRTGVVTGSRLAKVEPGRALELTRFGERGGVPSRGWTKAVLENRLAKILNLWKYNFRLMAAEDLIFFKPAEEAKAALLAKRQARSEGLRGEAATDRARQILGYGQQLVAQARHQATQEGFTGSAHSRRTAEILNANRPEQLREDARQFALRITYNNDPYGALGFVSHLLNQAKGSPNRKVRLGANLIAPFTNIIANVVNESLNYTPVGAFRARWNGTELLGYDRGKLTVQQQADLRAELYGKALVGTALLSALALKAAGDLDDEDPDFAIYGAGPASAEDRRGLEAKGWLAHSIKIGDRYYSYANTPVAIPMSWLGGVYDRLRDARLFQNRSAQRTAESLPLMAATSAVGMGKVITEQSFLTGIMDIAQTVSEPQPEVGGRRLLKLGTRTATSAAIPNAVRQIDKFFDPTVYEQRNAEGVLVNAIPFVRGAAGKPTLNALGLPVENPLARQFTSTQAGATPIVKYLAETGNWPSLPDRNHIYERAGRTMTDAEYYDYVKASGSAALAKLSELKARGRLDSRIVNNEPKALTDQERAERIADVISTERERWRGKHGF